MVSSKKKEKTEATDTCAIRTERTTRDRLRAHRVAAPNCDSFLAPTLLESGGAIAPTLGETASSGELCSLDQKTMST